jgi:WD40 repeat protein
MDKQLRAIAPTLFVAMIVCLGCSKSPNPAATAGDGVAHSTTDESAKPVLRATIDSCNGPVEFSGDGKTLAVGGSSPNGPVVRLVDVATYKVRSTLAKKTRLYATTVAFSHDDKLLATGWEDEVILWDVANGDKKQALRAWDGLGMINRLIFSPDGKILAAIGQNTQQTGEVKLWDMATANEIATLSENPNVVHDGAFSADGKQLATVGFDKSLSTMSPKLKCTIHVWDIAGKKVVNTFHGPADGIGDSKGVVVSAMQIRFGDDHKLQALGRWNETMKLWDVGTGQAITTFKGRSGFVISAAFSHDGKLLVGGNKDGSVTIWNAATGSELSTIPAHDSWVGGVAFNGVATILATVGGPDASTQLKLWSLTPK